jgi:hypothetical protein
MNSQKDERNCIAKEDSSVESHLQSYIVSPIWERMQREASTRLNNGYSAKV